MAWKGKAEVIAMKKEKIYTSIIKNLPAYDFPPYVFPEPGVACLSRAGGPFFQHEFSRLTSSINLFYPPLAKKRYIV